MSILEPSKIRVAVIRGGPSSEYDVSMKTGQHVLSIIRERPELYDPLDIFISKSGEWHRSGLVEEPHQALRHTDVVWNALHGSYGEDGQVQRLLERMQIPFTGPTSMAAALSMDKHLTKEHYKRHSLLTPRHELLRAHSYTDDHLLFIFKNYLHPVIIKPASSGSSIGMKVASSYQELREGVAEALRHSKKVLVEELIRGKEATCGVVDDFRGKRHYALLPIEIRRPKNAQFFNYTDKYSGEVEEISPGNFSSTEREALEDLAIQAHSTLGLRHYSRSDFIITPKGKIYILETNSLPGFTTESLMPKAIGSVGWSPQSFVHHILSLAL